MSSLSPIVLSTIVGIPEDAVVHRLNEERVECQPRLRIAVGPRVPGWGSWEWVGRYWLEELSPDMEARSFDAWEVPDADVVIVIKHPPTTDWVTKVTRRASLIYCPIDHYTSHAAIAADADWLSRCSRVVVHCRRLLPYFRRYSQAVYLDHPLRYAAPLRQEFVPDGRILWVGVRSNLPALVEWVNRNPLPRPLDVLTNPEDPARPPTPVAFGFDPARDVTIHVWNPARQRELTGTAQAALDVKADDFRSQHKPPAKALDFLASGLPLALEPTSSAAEHLAECGFAVASPNDPGRWFSREYWEESRRFGRKVRLGLAPSRMASAGRAIIHDALADRTTGRTVTVRTPNEPVRIAVLSLLFNWPSTGGGTVHTAELTRFLADAGFEVRHFYARYDPWGVGQVTAPTPAAAEALTFTSAEWHAAAVQHKFRRAVTGYDPDYGIITDSWNFKPLLAEAAAGFRYVLRLPALEGICPLNNVRLLHDDCGRPCQCANTQLRDPAACRRCVLDRVTQSGDLHRAERAFSEWDRVDYPDRLRRAFGGAHAVLAVNPEAADLVRPFTRDVRVVTAGMDPGRFPAPVPPPARENRKVRILFAGLAREWMKGFHVLHAAARLLWTDRQDFELVVTDEPCDSDPQFTRFVGWQSQADLPNRFGEADIVVVPTVAQEGLGRTAVEAMAAGRPVVAARIGGLPTTVPDGTAGLLFSPGDPGDLAAKLNLLLDDPGLCTRLGAAGRQRFETEYSWPVVIERHYRPLLMPVSRR